MQKHEKKDKAADEHSILDKSLFDYYISMLLGKYKSRYLKRQDLFESRKKPKRTFTVQLPPCLIEKIRDAAYWTEGLTMSKMSENAYTFWLAFLEKQRGEPFPPREGKLKEGRPRKSQSENLMDDQIDFCLTESSPTTKNGKAQLILITLKETADLLKVSRKQAYRMCRSGEFPHVRIAKSIRCKKEDIESYINEHTTKIWQRVDKRGRPKENDDKRDE